MPEAGVPGFVFEWLKQEQVIVSVQGSDANQAEWDLYAELLQSVATVKDVRCLWYTEGARPPLQQQQRFSSIGSQQKWLVAVVSPSPALRFAVSAFSMTNPNLRYFTPPELPEAFAHMHCTPAEQSFVQRALTRLRRRFDEPAQDVTSAAGVSTLQHEDHASKTVAKPRR
jgi:hypothetical protein